MKILSLHFKNINSLEGETRIDFTQAPLANAGVFAITGANGSGKSTVLDALTLGLYGETFRFNKPAAHVITKDKTDSFAVVQFSLGAEVYQSGWRVERLGNVPTGEVQAANMQLVRVNTGETLATTPQQVCQQMLAITGMSFRHFTRAVLLAQGDFAAFLNALDTERLDILEKIISSDIYADYQQDIKQKADKAKQTVQQLEAQIAAMTLLAPEKVEAHEHDLADFKEQLTELQQENQQLKKQQEAVKNVSVLQAQLNVQKKNIKQSKTEAEQLEQQLANIAAHQNVLIFQEDVAFLNQQQSAISQHKTELNSLQTELVQLKTKLGTSTVNVSDKSVVEQQQVISQLKNQASLLNVNAQSEVTLSKSLEVQIAEKQNQLLEVESWLELHTADASLLAQFPDIEQLNQARAELNDLSGQHKRITRQTKEAAAALDSNRAALEREQKKLAQAQQELEANEQELSRLLAEHSLEKIDDLRADQQERVKLFQEMNDIAAVYQRLKPSNSVGWLSFFGKKNKAEELDLEELNRQYEELRLEVLREENIKTLLEQTVMHESLLKKLADNREHLIDGKPCPLCGALEHPYTAKPPRLTNSQQALHHQQAKIKDLLAKTYDISHRLEAAKHQAERSSSNWARRQRLSSQWLMLCNRLNTVHPDLSIDNLALMAEFLAREHEELKNITALALHYRQTQHNITKLNTTIEKATQTLAQLQTAVDGFTKDTEARQQELQDFNDRLQHCQQREQQLSEQVIGQLTALGEAIPSNKNKEDLLFKRLTARKTDYESHLQGQQGLQNDLNTLNEKLTQCMTEIKAYKTQIDTLNTTLQNEETVSLHLALVEKQRLIADKEALIQLEQSILMSRQQALESQMQPQFSTLQALREMLALLQSKDKLLPQLQRLQNDIAAKTQTMEKLAADLDSDFQLAEHALSPEQLNKELRRSNEQLDITQSEIRRLERALNDHYAQQQKLHRLNAQLKQQQLEAEPYLTELAQLATDDGRVFRRKVQQQLIDRLLANSNSVLEKISGRYYVRQGQSEQGLALLIEDTLQANAKRLPKTLSGGESFVVSLALALGLAEMASNGRSVDSLFIDEGFGALDADTLYVILNTLENLHHQGKTVGVISHVEAIQKRFKAQLQVVKKPNGLSELQSVA